MLQDMFSASIVIVALIVCWVVTDGSKLKYFSVAAMRIPPADPDAGSNAQLFSMSIPIVSISWVRVQFSIFVSWRQTIIAPDEIMKLRVLALLAPSLSPLTFQHRMLQLFCDMYKIFDDFRITMQK
jgi:hypothetical protein